MNNSNSNVGISDIIKNLNDLCSLNLNNSDYDGIMCKNIPGSDLDSNSPFKTGHQTHIAITGDRMDLFPALWVSDANSQVLKSFLFLKVPVTLYQKNISYSYKDNFTEYGDSEKITSYDTLSKLTVTDFNNKSTLSTNMSVKLGHTGKQIELSAISKDIDRINAKINDIFKQFHKIFLPKDILVIAKRKCTLSYDAFIIRKKDSDMFPIGMYFVDNIKKFSTTVDSQISVFDNPNTIEGKNIIYYGAPGTGKSHKANEFAMKYSNDDDSNIFRTTLHPEYTYSDFAGQLVPTKDKDKGITYSFKPGIFTEALKYAVKNKDENVFLILEEMSRANVAAVFGDIFQLLDRKNGVSEYPIRSDDIFDAVNDNSDVVSEDTPKYIVIPRNMTILGTVNTSDQNVFVMDTAFKRRFNWEYVPVDEAADSDAFKKHNNPIIFEDDDITWEVLYKALNDFIVNDLKLTEDKQIGPFFIKFEDASVDEAYNLVKEKLLQYLWEDICSSSYTGDNKEKLFRNDISSFSTLYTRFSHKDEVFSSIFDAKLENQKKELEGKDESDS